MGYALFAQRKVELTGQMNIVSLQQTQRSNEQYLIATQTLTLNQQLTNMTAAQSSQLATLFGQLASAENSTDRERINNLINARQNDFERENQAINNRIYLTAVKEQAIELEVKRLDTQISSLEKQLKAVEDAEGNAIERATPKFKGVG